MRAPGLLRVELHFSRARSLVIHSDATALAISLPDHRAPIQGHQTHYHLENALEHARVVVVTVGGYLVKGTRGANENKSARVLNADWMAAEEFRQKRGRVPPQTQCTAPPCAASKSGGKVACVQTDGQGVGSERAHKQRGILREDRRMCYMRGGACILR